VVFDLLKYIAVFACAFKYAITTSRVKPVWHRFLTSFPILGVFIQNIHLAYLFRNLGTMLSVGIPISTALEAQYKTVTNHVYKDILERMYDACTCHSGIQ
jgi:type II secretory pathway component PulF